MKTFKINALGDWLPVSVGEIIAFEAGRSGRTVKLALNVSHPVQLFAAENPDMEGEVLVGASDGMFDVEVSSRTALFFRLVCESEEVVAAFVRSKMQDQHVERMSFEKFTTIEQRRSRNPELDRMMMLMKHNEMERDKRLAVEIANLKASIASQPPVEQTEVIEDEVHQDDDSGPDEGGAAGEPQEAAPAS